MRFIKPPPWLLDLFRRNRRPKPLPYDSGIFADDNRILGYSYIPGVYLAIEIHDAPDTFDGRVKLTPAMARMMLPIIQHFVIENRKHENQRRDPGRQHQPVPSTGYDVRTDVSQIHPFGDHDPSVFFPQQRVKPGSTDQHDDSSSSISPGVTGMLGDEPTRNAGRQQPSKPG